MVFNARPPFDVLKVIETGPITNHVNIARNTKGQFAYVTVGGLNQVKAFRTDTFEQASVIPTGVLPHGVWPSGDGARMYVGLENADAVAVIDTLRTRSSQRSALDRRRKVWLRCRRRATGRRDTRSATAWCRRKLGPVDPGWSGRKARDASLAIRPGRRSNSASRGNGLSPKSPTSWRSPMIPEAVAILNCLPDL